MRSPARDHELERHVAFGLRIARVSGEVRDHVLSGLAVVPLDLQTAALELAAQRLRRDQGTGRMMRGADPAAARDE